MLQMDLTQVNVLTKIDNLHKFPDLPFNLDYYTEVQDLDYLLPALERESPMFATGKFASLNKAVCQLIEEFGLVGYETLAVEDKKSMIQLLRTIDRANGYVFGGAEGAGDGVWQTAIRQGMGEMSIKDVQDRWIDNKEWWDEKERQEEEEERSKPKHKRGSRAGKKVKKDSRSEGSTEQAKPKKDPKDKNGGFFEEIDAAAEKVRLAPIYELSKKKAKIASGRTEVSAGVLEDTTSTLSKARKKEAKSRMELDSFDDNAAAESLGKGKNAKSSKKVTKGEDGDKEDKVVNTSVAGIIDLRKQKGKDGKKRKAEPANKGEKKKPRASLPFSEKQVQDAFGSGGDAWGNAGAWA